MSTDPIPSRLANLPGYDASAPDFYETTSSTSTTTTTTTTQPTSPPLPSDPSETSSEGPSDASTSASDAEGEAEPFGILSRRRLYPDAARRRFGQESRGLGSKRVDLSDRVDGRRKGYRVRRRGSGGSEGRVVGVEGLEARVARLRREVEEVRALARDSEGGDGDGGVEELVGLLAGVEVPAAGRRRQQVERGVVGEEGEGEGEEQTLRKVAEFDSRLSALEQALGVASMFDASNATATATPVLPTLTVLDQQLAALSSSTSIANLEAASARLSKLRSQVEVASSRPTSSSDDSEVSGVTPDDLTKLQSLYTLLPTLQSLSPTVPALLTRLHSLRTLHAGAASAASELEDIEKRQAEMERELKAWREGLEKVEEAVEEASESNGKNGRVVGTWVKELEERMKMLGR